MSRPAVLIALCTGLLAGCGGDEEGGGRALTVPAGKAVRVTADEYSFAPSRVVVEGGPGEVTMTLENVGALAHDLRIFDGDRELGGTPSFDGGMSRSGNVRLEPGRYRMVCTVGDHEELGMVGTLEVR